MSTGTQTVSADIAYADALTGMNVHAIDAALMALPRPTIVYAV